MTGGVVTKYYYAGAQRIAMRKDGTLNYLLGDHLGSTSLTTDASGNVVSELRYKAWGEVRYASGVTPTDYTYTGQYSYASDFGLMYYNARWYDPSLGRFAQADTIVPGGVQGYDRYAYANNSPLNYVDPSGHDGECPPFLAKFCELVKSALSRWEEAKANQCSMMLTGCPSYPTSPMDAVKKTAQMYAANNWGAITPEQIRRIGQITDTIQRVAALNKLFGSPLTERVEDTFEFATSSRQEQLNQFTEQYFGDVGYDVVYREASAVTHTGSFIEPGGTDMYGNEYPNGAIIITEDAIRQGWDEVGVTILHELLEQYGYDNMSHEEMHDLDDMWREWYNQRKK